MRDYLPLPATLAALATLALPASAGETMYATSQALNGTLITVDTATGAVLSAKSITNDEALYGGLTFSADGSTLYSIDGKHDGISERTFQIDPDTGAGQVIGDTGYNWNYRCVDTDPITGTLYATTDTELFVLDTTTGLATSVTMLTAPTLDNITTFAIDGSGNAFATDRYGPGLFTLDLATGAMTHVGDFGTSDYFRDLAFDSSGVLWGVGTLSGGMYNIDTATANATLMFSSPEYGGIAFKRISNPGLGYCFGDVGSGTPCPCANDNDGSVPGSGCANGVFLSGARLAGSGIASVGADTMVLATSGLEPSNAGLYFQADNDLSPGTAWGDGLRCAGGNLKRLGVVFSDAGGYSDTSGLPLPISVKAGNVSVGDTKYYQCWYRNTTSSPCVSEFNASNGYAVTWRM